MPILIQVTEETNRQGINSPAISKLYGVPSISLVRDNGTSATIILDGKRSNEERIVSETYSTISDLIDVGYTDGFVLLDQANGDALSLRAANIVEVQENDASESIITYRDNDKQVDVQYVVTETMVQILALLPTGGGLGSENLLQTLANGNITGANDIEISNSQVIKAENGNSSIDLRNGGIDGSIFIKGDSYNNRMGTFFVDDVVSTMNGGQTGMGIGLWKGDLSKLGQIYILNNEIIDVSSGSLPNYPTLLGSQLCVVKAGVINTTILAGINLIAKTDNTAYGNQIGFNAGLAGEMLLKHTPNAGNFVATLKPETGTIAYLTDVSSLYGSDGTIGAGRIATLTDTLEISKATQKLTIGGTSFLDIEVAGGQSPVTFYKNAGAGVPASVGDLTNLTWSYNDSLGVRTGVASNIVCRVTGVGSGSVNSSLVLSGLMNITNGGILIHPSATTQSVNAMFQIKQTASSPFSNCLSLVSKGNTAAFSIISANNLAVQNALRITGDLKSVFNGSQLSTGDFQHKGFTDSNLFYSDAGLDRVGIGTATAQISSKLTITGDTETLGNTNGFIVLDRTNATRYRIYSDGGVLSIEVA